MTERLVSRFFSGAPVAIAHRGGSRLRPENTLAAFDHALALGADALECDVHLSRDGEPVVIHDATLDRTTDASGPVAARTADQLGRLDAGFRFDPDALFPWRGRGVGVPRLADLVARCANRPLIVEIKGEDVRTAERALDVILACGALDRVVFAGFSQAVLDAVRARSRDAVTSASRLEVQSAVRRAYFRLGPRRAAYRVFQAPLRVGRRRVLTPPLVRALGRVEIPTQAWIVDEVEQMRELLAWGVTGLISDRPDRAVEVARQFTKGLRLEA